jgi:serine/threonine-protein kinase
VLSTDPAVGTEVAERTTVNLTVGRGPASVTVPRLEGMTVEQATALLEERGLQMGTQTTQETSDTNQVGKIIESNPRAGETVPGQTQVTVVVGTEATTVEIPDLSGQDPDDAEQTLRGLGFTRIEREGDGNSDARVSGTDPPAGSKVSRDSEVTLQLGEGDEIQMPDVRGQQIQDAEDQLRDLGFTRVQSRSEPVENENQDNRVIDQSVRPGQTVSPDERIELTYGDAPGLIN